jgi:hypothetical protein
LSAGPGLIPKIDLERLLSRPAENEKSIRCRAIRMVRVMPQEKAGRRRQPIHKGSEHDAEIVVGMICRVYSWLA